MEIEATHPSKKQNGGQVPTSPTSSTPFQSPFTLHQPQTSNQPPTFSPGQQSVQKKELFKQLPIEPPATPVEQGLVFPTTAQHKINPKVPTGFYVPEIKYSDVRFESNIVYIGKGAYATVAKGILLNELVAVKLLNKQSLDYETLKAIKNEVYALSASSHENIVRLMGACLEPNFGKGEMYMICLEYCDDSLSQKITRNRLHNEWALSGRIEDCKSIALGLQWMHEILHISHGDLKPENILIKHNVIKVGDFGFATFRSEEKVIDTRGTAFFMAPEVMRVILLLHNKKKPEGHNPFKADIYSFGLIMWCIISGNVRPFGEFKDTDSFTDFSNAVMGEAVRPVIPSSCPPLLSDLIERCWAANPEDRPSWDFIIFTLNECLVDSLAYNSTIRSFWKKYFLMESNNFYLEREVTWDQYVGALVKATALPASSFQPLKPLFLKNGLLGKPEGAEVVTLEIVDQNALLFGADFTSNQNTKALATLHQMTMLAKHEGFHGSIAREEAVSRLQKYKHLGVVWLLRSRNPRTNKQTGSPLTISVFDPYSTGDQDHHVSVYYDPEIGSTYCISVNQWLEFPSLEKLLTTSFVATLPNTCPRHSDSSKHGKYIGV